MDIKELKANHPELVKMIEDETLQTVESDTVALKNKVSSLEEANASLTNSLTEKEKELSSKKATEIFETAFESSSIPSKFSGRVLKDTNLDSFIGSDGKLDSKGYSDSVSAAIASWEEDCSDLIKKDENKEDKKEEQKDENKEEQKDEKKEILGFSTLDGEDAKNQDELVEHLVKLATK